MNEIKWGSKNKPRYILLPVEMTVKVIVDSFEKMRLQQGPRIWTVPRYDISKEPALEATLKILPDAGSVDFPRVAKWCPDGSAVLAQCENGSLQLFDVRRFNQAAPVLDFIWYPMATPRDPATFCFVASVRECPVKLLDGSDGRLRASYRIVDHRERQVAPHSLAFNLTAQKFVIYILFDLLIRTPIPRLYCGFEDAIEVFDISRPGEGTRIHTTPSKKSKDGLKVLGIISALAFSPSYSQDESFYAAGSFSSSSYNIAMFSDSATEPLMLIGGGPEAGVTQLQFNPAKPHILYATYRGQKSGSVYSWDIRSNVASPLEIFQAPSRNTSTSNRTNQKIKFDVDLSGHFLSIGDQVEQGHVSLFDLSNPENLEETSTGSHNNVPEVSYETKVTYPINRFKAHDDAVGSVAFNPFRSSLLSVSGSRHFMNDYSDEESDSESDTESGSGHNDMNSPHSKMRRMPRRTQPVTFDSTIKIWDFK
ncbi:hypothetical protein CPB84DRAFT_1744519 [Gymnopilus junonius]|uniref:Transducin/WD40 repeat-like superfamily protein n=1 Tax=Gymnopilus junonius TaxID=109634 RepID=A0A9P5TQW1_GYMJU|nr:hypothetical protein CPB84DRAFT_1744519 [Gymnopilus junonius]